MESLYDFKSVEARWQQIWEDEGLYQADPEAPGETFVVGDLEPCRQIEMVSWLCEQLALPLPPSAPLEAVHETLRRNRRIDVVERRCVLQRRWRNEELVQGASSCGSPLI